jgi:ankyrin repeat protein
LYVEELIDSRDNFVASMSGVVKRHDLPELRCLAETQLLIPADLFTVPNVVSAVQNDGRRDCLLRPVGHILHDNKVDETFVFSEYEDGHDVLGRSRLHLACSLTADEQSISDLEDIPYPRWLDHCVLGLNPLHIAAVHGNTALFAVASESVHDIVASSYTRPSLHTGRTHLHWAACFGHLKLVQYLLDMYDAKHDHRIIALVCRDRRGDTPMHLAARNGHTEVVQTIIQYTVWNDMKRVCLRHTPFWAAVSGCHLDIMRLLEPFSNVEEDELGRLTPLAEASRQGFAKGVEYLLQLKAVGVNSINYHWHDEAKEKLLKTPLDLATEGGHEKCIELLRAHGALLWQELALSPEDSNASKE